MKITIKKSENQDWRGDDLTIDLDERFGGFEAGDMICKIDNFGCLDSPIGLEFAIAKNGEIRFRAWSINRPSSSWYAQLHDSSWRVSDATDAQRKAVAGMITGRVKFRGVKIAIGASVQDAVGGIPTDMIEGTPMNMVMVGVKAFGGV